MNQRLFALWLAALLAACGGETEPVRALRLATTTSARDSGLLDRLLPLFEARAGCRVEVIAVGTGAALRLGAAGDADVVLVHSKADEIEFIRSGHGVRREEFMRNHFTILGPPDDPAHARALSAAGALESIADSRATFVSRGDDSGTHRRELACWKSAGGLEPWRGYVESGQGMGATIVMADEMRGYTLADEGTWLRFREKVDLAPMVGHTERLRNPYGVLVVSPERTSPDVARRAHLLADFLISSEAQRVIEEFTIDGDRLFEPLRPEERPR